MSGMETALAMLNACALWAVELEPGEEDLAPFWDELRKLHQAWPANAESRDELGALLDADLSDPDCCQDLLGRIGGILQEALEQLQDAEDQGGSDDGALQSHAEKGAGVTASASPAEPRSPTSSGEPLPGDGAAAAPTPTGQASGSGASSQAPALELVDAAASEADAQAVPTAEELYALPPDADEGLVADFVAEGLEYLDQAEEALLTLEVEPGNAEAVNVTFRAFHTIKGVSAFLELEHVTRIAHETETLLARVREGTLAFTGAAADLFLTAADVLRGLLVGLRETVSGGHAGVPGGLASLLDLLARSDIADRVARNEPLGLGRSAAAEDEGPEDEEATDGPREGQNASHAEDSVRVRTERLDRLVDLVGELVIAHSMISQDRDVVGNNGDLQKKVSQSQKILRELQDLSTSIRMVPLKPAFHKISRVVRDVTRKSGKKVSLVTSGEETELDRGMVAVITDSLVHMVRNSIDHGIEDSDERRAQGKPSGGILRLAARQAGGNVVLEIEDDGRGLDRDRILAKAVERGLVSSDRTMADDEVFALIFHPGFSTAEQVTDISGRGVGMDVVRRAVESLRGRIEIRSERGKGTKFSIFLPLTLAITDGMLVRVGSERYIIPTVKIQFSFRPGDDDLWTVSGKGEMVMVHDNLLPVARLHRLFGVEGALEDPTRGILMVVGEGSRRAALMVDELLGQQQFVVKPLSGLVAGTQGIAGGAILGDGGVGLILDPEEITAQPRHRGGGARDVA